MLIRQFPAIVLMTLIALAMATFIIFPLGSILWQSVVVEKPMSVHELRDRTLDAMSKMDESERAVSMDRWLKAQKISQRAPAMAAAFELIGETVDWNTKASFDDQIIAAEDKRRSLTESYQLKFETAYTHAFIMLHKRTALAFKIKDRVSSEEFALLREGNHKVLGFDHYASLYVEPRIAKAAINSLLFSTIASVIATTLAFIISYGVNRRIIPFPNLVRYGTLIPLVSPPVMIAFSAVLLFGREGAFTRGFLDRFLGLINSDETNLYGFAGVVLAQVISYLPPAYIVIDNVLSKHDGRVEEAAAIQGASPWQTFCHVTLPLCQPGIVRALILVFILTMTDFANPMVIGQGIPVLAGVLYDEMTGFQNTSLAAALAVWMIVPAVCIYFVLENIGRRKRFYTGNATGGSAEIPVPMAAKVVATTLAYAVITTIAVLYGAVIVGSFVKLWGVDNSFTPHWYTTVDAVPGFSPEFRGMELVWFSMKVAVITAPLGGLLAVALAYLIDRIKVPGMHILSFISMLPAALPGVIFGVGYIIAFNNPFGIKELAITGTMWILVLNILFANIFVGILAGRSALQRIDTSVDEAAEILGASLYQRFFFVVLPMMRHAALLGTLYIFVHTMTTLSAVIFLISPGNILASYGIFTSALNSYYGYASAQSVTILVIVFVVMGVIWWFENHGPAWSRLGAKSEKNA